GADDDTIRLWDPASGKELRKTVAGHGALSFLAVSADGKTMASGGRDKTVRLWEVATGRPLHELKGHRSTIAGLAFAPDGRTLRFWDPATGRELRQQDYADYRFVLPGKPVERAHNPRAIYAVDFAPDGSLLAVGGYQVCQLIDPRTGKRKVAINLPVGDVNLS